MKHLLCLVSLISLPALAQKKPVRTPIKYELRGIVTYFSNQSTGYKADVGATAYIIKAGILPLDSLDTGAAEAYRSANVIYSLSTSSHTEAMLPGEETPKQHYLSTQARLNRAIGRLSNNPTTAIATTDGQGIFTKKLSPATYWILIKSAGRIGAQMKKVVVSDNDIEVAAKFEVD